VQRKRDIALLFSLSLRLWSEKKATGFRLQASGYRLQATGFRLQASGFRLQASGYRLQATAGVLVLVLVLVLGFFLHRVSRRIMFDCGNPLWLRAKPAPRSLR
jgi:hypothetical protein